MTKRFIALLLVHNSFALILVGDFIIAASDQQISIRKSGNKQNTGEKET